MYGLGRVRDEKLLYYTTISILKKLFSRIFLVVEEKLMTEQSSPELLIHTVQYILMPQLLGITIIEGDLNVLHDVFLAHVMGLVGVFNIV